MKSQKQKMRDKVSLYAKTHLWRIPDDKFTLPSHCMSNQACHFNSVAAVDSGRANQVWLVIANGVVHFINSKDGKFFDETWGRFIDDVDYHVIRRIHKGEYNDVYEILCDTKKSLVNMLGSPIQKWMQSRSVHSLL